MVLDFKKPSQIKNEWFTLREKGSGANTLTFRQNHPTLLISGHPKICGSM